MYPAQFRPTAHYRFEQSCLSLPSTATEHRAKEHEQESSSYALAIDCELGTHFSFSPSAIEKLPSPSYRSGAPTRSIPSDLGRFDGRQYTSPIRRIKPS